MTRIGLSVMAPFTLPGTAFELLSRYSTNKSFRLPQSVGTSRQVCCTSGCARWSRFGLLAARSAAGFQSLNRALEDFVPELGNTESTMTLCTGGSVGSCFIAALNILFIWNK